MRKKTRRIHTKTSRVPTLTTRVHQAQRVMEKKIECKTCQKTVSITKWFSHTEHWTHKRKQYEQEQGEQKNETKLRKLFACTKRITGMAMKGSSSSFKNN